MAAAGAGRGPAGRAEGAQGRRWASAVCGCGWVLWMRACQWCAGWDAARWASKPAGAGRVVVRRKEWAVGGGTSERGGSTVT